MSIRRPDRPDTANILAAPRVKACYLPAIPFRPVLCNAKVCIKVNNNEHSVRRLNSQTPACHLLIHVAYMQSLVVVTIQLADAVERS